MTFPARWPTCLACGGILEGERTNGLISNRGKKPEDHVAHWFLTCEECGTEYHGFPQRATLLLKLVPLAWEPEEFCVVEDDENPISQRSNI